MLLSNAFLSDPRVLNEATALIGAGYEVTLFAWDRGEGVPKKELKDGISIRRFSFPSRHAAGIRQVFPLSIIWLQWFVAGLFQKFDVLHCHDFDTLPIGWLLARIKGKKVIFDSHEVYSGMMKGHLDRKWMRCLRALEHFFINKIDALIVPSKIFLRYYRTHPSKICVVGNWKTVEDYKIADERKDELKRVLKIPPLALVITYIGSLGEERVIEPLLQAVVRLESFFLIIAGDGIQRALVESYKQPNIKYMGFLSGNKQLRDLTALSDIIFYGIKTCTFSGRNNSPHKLYEALAAGKPFIFIGIREGRRLIREHQIGVLMKEQTTEEIERILRDLYEHPEKRKIMGDNGLRLARERFNWGLAKRNLLDLYAGL